MDLISPGNSKILDRKYTCESKTPPISPPLSWNRVEGALGYTLTMIDIDSPSKVYVHWIIPYISPAINYLQPGENIPSGLNSKGTFGYTPPCPPRGTGSHRYIFEIYALKTQVDLKYNWDFPSLKNAIQPYIIDYDQLVLYYTNSREFYS